MDYQEKTTALDFTTNHPASILADMEHILIQAVEENSRFETLDTVSRHQTGIDGDDFIERSGEAGSWECSLGERKVRFEFTGKQTEIPVFIEVHTGQYDTLHWWLFRLARYEKDHETGAWMLSYVYESEEG